MAENEKVILLLGEINSGKTTLINSLFNYVKHDDMNTKDVELPIGIHLSWTHPDTYGIETVSLGAEEDLDNEKDDIGHSTTQDPRVYKLEYDNCKYVIIDTPGIGDCNGMEKDKISMKKIVNCVALHKTKIHICMVMDANCSNKSIEYFFDTIFSYFKDTSYNFVFCFTKSKRTGYSVGDNFTFIKQTLPSNIQDKLNRESIFCVDNEGMKHALILSCPDIDDDYKKDLKTFEKEARESWRKSAIEIKRLLTTVAHHGSTVTEASTISNRLRSLENLNKPSEVKGYNTEVDLRSYQYQYTIEDYNHVWYPKIIKRLKDIEDVSFYAEKQEAKWVGKFGFNSTRSSNHLLNLLNSLGPSIFMDSYNRKAFVKVSNTSSQNESSSSVIVKNHHKHQEVPMEALMSPGTNYVEKNSFKIDFSSSHPYPHHSQSYDSDTTSHVHSDQSSTHSHPLLTLLDSHKDNLSEEKSYTHVDENTKVILLVGETGAGKSTFVNSIVNYFKHETLPTNDIEVRIGMILSIIDPDTYDDAPVYFGPKGSRLDDNDEFTETGESSTQDAKTHEMTIKGQKYIFIDTPGMGDSRGVPQDKINMDKTIQIIKQFKTLSAICVLMSPGSKKLSESVRNSINIIFDTFRRPTFPNVLFCVTKTRPTADTPGDIFVGLKNIVDKELSNRFNMKTIYSYENEGLMYALKMSSDLVAKKIKAHLERDRNSQEDSWKKSRESALRMVDTIRELKPVDTDLIVLTYYLNKMIFDLKSWEDIETQKIANNLLIKLEDIRTNIDSSNSLTIGNLLNEIKMTIKKCQKEIIEEERGIEERKDENVLYYGIPLKKYQKLLSLLVTSKHEGNILLKKLVHLVGHLKGCIPYSPDMKEIIQLLLSKKGELLPEPFPQELKIAEQTLDSVCNGFHNTAHLKYNNYYGVRIFEGKLKMHYVSILGKMHYVQNTMKDCLRGHYLTNSSIEWKCSTKYKNPTSKLEKDLLNSHIKKDEMLDEWNILKGRFASEKHAEEFFIVCAILHNWLVVGN